MREYRRQKAQAFKQLKPILETIRTKLIQELSAKAVTDLRKKLDYDKLPSDQKLIVDKMIQEAVPLHLKRLEDKLKVWQEEALRKTLEKTEKLALQVAENVFAKRKHEIGPTLAIREKRSISDV